MKNIHTQKSGLFSYLLALTGLFILVEISFFIQSEKSYLSEFHYISKHLPIPLSVLPGVVYFIFAQLLLHLLFTFFIWLTARLMGIALSLAWPQVQKLGISLWVISLVTVLIANQYYFPLSQFTRVTSFFVPNIAATTLFILFSGLIGIAVLLAFVGALYLTIRNKILILILLVGAMPLFYWHYHQTTILDAATAEKPNIIIIGVDSLRPDFLSYFGHKKKTPTLDALLGQSTVFSQALTPLARTFPAWVSILTGEYPKKNGARSNLVEQNHLDISQTLPAILREHGYETLFAMDETRFSNIDKNYGFDDIVTPPMGFNDFLLGTMNDFPLSNIMVNSRLGQWLFPYSFANRPAYITYQPNSFIELIQSQLLKSHRKPVFLAVHFCLPHFPYFWAGLNTHNEHELQHYQAAVLRVDEQVHDFLMLLQKSQLLQHSVIVILSDHGEALELHGDRVTLPGKFIAKANKNNSLPHFFPASFDFEAIDQSAGHGTDVLGYSQYHSLLAFKITGVANYRTVVQQINENVSLLDIKPTLLSLLQIPYKEASGESLVTLITQQKVKDRKLHDFFIESDFSPQAVKSVHPEMRKVLFEGMDYFQINPVTSRLTVKESMLNLIISSKQYADIYGSWILALYPQKDKAMQPILVNLKTRQWTNDLSTHFAINSPAQHMLQALKEFYGKEVVSAS